MGETPSRTTSVPPPPAAAGGGPAWRLRLSALIVALLSWRTPSCAANADTKRLYHDLINGYSSLIRPVGNNSDRLTVKMGLRLSQLIDVNLKNQIMTTNVWVEQEWNDYKLRWDPEEYGGVTKVHVPAEQIWLPDIVLYNNADGNYEVTIMTKAILHSDGLVIWKPPAIYKSSCEIDVQYFPFDQQTCFMKFGSWTYDGYTVDLKHKHQRDDSNDIAVGIDLSEFYLSVEWDIMAVPARRKEKFYSCCEEPFPDITFNITLRRKTLFYTVNLIIPCVAISFLSVLVFYLPSDSGEKVSLSISIMLSLGVFFLLLSEIIPPTSLAVPLLGKYLLFTMVLVSLSVFVTIAVLNVNFRSPATHKMAPWVKHVFLKVLPPVLLMKRPQDDDDDDDASAMGFDATPSADNRAPPSPPPPPPPPPPPLQELTLCAYHSAEPPESGGDDASPRALPSPPDGGADPGPLLDQDLARPVFNVRFIAQHMENADHFDQVIEDWRYVAMVLDRLFLLLFTFTCVVGSACIILEAPSLFDDKLPIDILMSKVAPRLRRIHD
ncbi:acetylcholine receptor subunit alpha-like 1 [Rhipicephalus sanguineus]|uniref:acetylcholine receptor subunit alpha-like 1 n=1 Tax=Rhipicephalus sanguineus TaxID=34632 RepID=UPI001895C64B|nr:acetylcholine receptor subunit alpha-like 1 [Rhipicephalus sanguineus]